MSKIAVAELRRDLEAAEQRWQNEVQSIANEARKLMLPHFTKYNLVYVAGNGSWYLGKKTEGSTFAEALRNEVDEDTLPQWIREMLRIEVGRGFRLGDYIEDIGQ
jgi:hypothetical protein